MDREVLTGKDLNQIKEHIADDEVAKVLKSAQKQLDRKMGAQTGGSTENQERMLQAQERMLRAQELKERAQRMVREEEEKRKRERAEMEAKEAEETTPAEPDMAIEDDVYIDKSLIPVEYHKDKITFGQVFGGILEFIWTCFKLAVVISIVTVVAGFILSRNLMVRGRNGVRESVKGMNISAQVAANKSAEDEAVSRWLASVKREKLTLEADDKSVLVARQIVTDAASDKWVVILHGYNGNMEDVYDIAMHYAEEGYNILTPDLRANGESEGSFLGMGWLDRLDIINWIDVILEENPSAEVAIHGIDTGADAALMLSGEPLKSNIKAIVAEGAYTSAWEAVKKEYEARYEKWPVFPFMYMMAPVMKVWAGYTLHEADAVEQVSKTSVPILLIRGKNDTYVTEDMMSELNQAISSPHDMLTVPTGTHEDCRYAEPDTYYDKTFDFVEFYVD